MKNLLILVLAVSMVSAANALVVQLSFNDTTDGANGETVGASNTFDVNQGDGFTIGVISDSDDIAYPRYVAVYDEGHRFEQGASASGFTLANGVIYGVGHGGVAPDGGDAGDDAVIGTPGPPNTLSIDAVDAGEPFNITAGTQFSWNLVCEQAGVNVYIDLTDESLNVLDRILVQQVPEPMTLGLLGFGGLLLRRKLRA